MERDSFNGLTLVDIRRRVSEFPDVVLMAMFSAAKAINASAAGMDAGPVAILSGKRNPFTGQIEPLSESEQGDAEDQVGRGMFGNIGLCAAAVVGEEIRARIHADVFSLPGWDSSDVKNLLGFLDGTLTDEESDAWHPGRKQLERPKLGKRSRFSDKDFGLN